MLVKQVHKSIQLRVKTKKHSFISTFLQLQHKQKTKKKFLLNCQLCLLEVYIFWLVQVCFSNLDFFSKIQDDRELVTVKY